MFLTSVGGLSCAKVALVCDVCVCVHVQMRVGGVDYCLKVQAAPSVPEEERLGRCRRRWKKDDDSFPK